MQFNLRTVHFETSRASGKTWTCVRAFLKSLFKHVQMRPHINPVNCHVDWNGEITYLNTKSLVGGGETDGWFWFDCDASSAQQAIWTDPFWGRRKMWTFYMPNCACVSIDWKKAKLLTINEHPTIFSNRNCPCLSPCFIDSQWSTFLHVPFCPSCSIHELPSASKHKWSMLIFQKSSAIFCFSVLVLSFRKQLIWHTCRNALTARSREIEFAEIHKTGFDLNTSTDDAVWINMRLIVTDLHIQMLNEPQKKHFYWAISIKLPNCCANPYPMNETTIVNGIDWNILIFIPLKTFFSLFYAKRCQYNDSRNSNQSNQNTWICIYVTDNLFSSTYFHTDCFPLASLFGDSFETVWKFFHYALQHFIL